MYRGGEWDASDGRRRHCDHVGQDILDELAAWLGQHAAGFHFELFVFVLD